MMQTVIFFKQINFIFSHSGGRIAHLSTLISDSLTFCLFVTVSPPPPPIPLLLTTHHCSSSSLQAQLQQQEELLYKECKDRERIIAGYRIKVKEHKTQAEKVDRRVRDMW